MEKERGTEGREKERKSCRDKINESGTKQLLCLSLLRIHLRWPCLNLLVITTAKAKHLDKSKQDKCLFKYIYVQPAKLH